MASQPQGGSSAFDFKDPFDLMMDLHNSRVNFVYKNEFARGNRPDMRNVGGGDSNLPAYDAQTRLNVNAPSRMMDRRVAVKPNNYGFKYLSAPQNFSTPELNRGEEGRIGKVAGPAISNLAKTANNLYQNRKFNKENADSVTRLQELEGMKQDTVDQAEALKTTITGNKTIASTRTAQRQQQAQQVKIGNQVNQATLVAGYGADPYANAYQAMLQGLPQQQQPPQVPAGPPRPPLWQNPPANMVPGGFAPPGPANNWHGNGPPAGGAPVGPPPAGGAGAPAQQPVGVWFNPPRPINWQNPNIPKPNAGGVVPGVGPNIQRRPKPASNLPLAPTNVAGPVSPISPPTGFDKSGNTQVLGGAVEPESTPPATETTGQSAPSTRPSLSDRRAQSRQRRGRGLNPG